MTPMSPTMAFGEPALPARRGSLPMPLALTLLALIIAMCGCTPAARTGGELQSSEPGSRKSWGHYAGAGGNCGYRILERTGKPRQGPRLTDH